MKNYDSSNYDLMKIYGNENIAIQDNSSRKNKENKTYKIFEKSFHFILEKLSIEKVLKEITFTIISLIVFIYLVQSGRLESLNIFGFIVAGSLLFSAFYNLLKASFVSLTPGVFCFIISLVLTKSTQLQEAFNFITADYINYVVGLGAFYVSLSLMRSQ